MDRVPFGQFSLASRSAISEWFLPGRQASFLDDAIEQPSQIGIGVAISGYHELLAIFRLVECSFQLNAEFRKQWDRSLFRFVLANGEPICVPVNAVPGQIKQF